MDKIEYIRKAYKTFLVHFILISELFPLRKNIFFLDCPDSPCWFKLKRNGEIKTNQGMIKNRSGSITMREVAYYIGNPSDNKQYQMIRHLCQNPHCVNPEHLKGGTYTDNKLDTVISTQRFKLIRMQSIDNGISTITTSSLLADRQWNVQYLSKFLNTNKTYKNYKWSTIHLVAGDMHMKSLLLDFYQLMNNRVAPITFPIIGYDPQTLKVIERFNTLQEIQKSSYTPSMIFAAVRRISNGSTLSLTSNGIYKDLKWDVSGM